MSGITKLKNAQEERRARQTCIDGEVIELLEELGLDLEVAEAHASRIEVLERWDDIEDEEEHEAETAGRVLALKRQLRTAEAV